MALYFLKLQITCILHTRHPLSPNTPQTCPHSYQLGDTNWPAKLFFPCPPYGSASSKTREAQTSASPGATYFSAKQAGSQAVWDDATQDNILYFRG